MRGITDLMTMPGLINLDFADIRTIMANTGRAMLGVGEATGEGRAIRAAEQAISNPLLDEAMKGARGLIISITGSDDIGLWEIDEIAGLVGGMADPDADIIWGSAFDQSLAGTIRVSVVATGIDLPAASTKVSAPAFVLPGVSHPPVPAKPSASPARQDAFRFPTEPRALSSPMPSYVPGAGNQPPPFTRRLQLTPPPGSVRFSTIDPFAGLMDGHSEPSASSGPPAHSASLFERMALMARDLAPEASDSFGATPTRHPDPYCRISPQQIGRAA